MTERPAPARKRERYHDDRTALYALLDEVHIGHFALCTERGPVVLPSLVVRDGDRILTHGSTGSAWLRAMTQGAAVSLAVTAVDAVVVARSGFESSLNYRSAVLFGACTVLDGADKAAALHTMTDRIIPGRSTEVRDHRPSELAASLILAMPIEEWTYKARAADAMPTDDAADQALEVWAGIVPLRTMYGEPVPAPGLRPDIPVPASVRSLR